MYTHCGVLPAIRRGTRRSSRKLPSRDNQYGASHALNGSDYVREGETYLSLCGRKVRADDDIDGLTVWKITEMTKSVVTCKKCLAKIKGV